ncbi:MAG: hypothetical protein HC908_06015 [Calothrix sp. SM1_7_51]|nr:hypothetical protein [Calothrix sp. SM1_7_51]
MKISTKLALVVVAVSSSLVGLASGAFAQTAPSQGIGGIATQDSPNAAAAVTFKIDNAGVTGAASAAIGVTSATATATTATDSSVTVTEDGTILPITNATTNTATAFGSSNPVSVTVGGTYTGTSGTGEIKLENSQGSQSETEPTNPE